MPILSVSPDVWRAYPGAAAGFLVMRGVSNPEHSPELDQRKDQLEAGLRSRYGGQEPSALNELPVVQAYNAYYKRFKKSYHVTPQLESVVWKGKSIPRTAALVEAMFMAELQFLLLTAGHDLDRIEPLIEVGVSQGTEEYTTLSGQARTCKTGDLFMADRQGVISSILYGPDQRTRLQPSTTNAVFAVYLPPGIPETWAYDHLRAIQSYVELISPAAVVDRLVILTA